MEYTFREIEKKWRERWIADKTYEVHEDHARPKYYVLDMFPYPSGAGLHVGHPLGYIASDIYARYKRLCGFNVLHPMGYDAYGLPAEQYAIQTGQHPEVTTVNNINRYREQLDKIGFSFDWSREVRTCEPTYYHWTQWAFLRMFGSYYCNIGQHAQPIEKLIAAFEANGTEGVNAACSEELSFTAAEWQAMSERERQQTLMNYRLAYLGDTMVNWCPQLGTVLANDEVSEGLSIRGGYPVEQKVMRQWCLRVSAYAQRLLDGLDTVDWSDSLKETQRNWIGRSEGAEMLFPLADGSESLKIFTTRADTVFGVTFMVLAPESEYVGRLTTDAQRADVEAYLEAVKRRTERERIADHKVTGVFSGSYAINPLTGEQIPIWISDYVLAGYGTGAIMAVPAHDQRDLEFALKFDLPIVKVLDVEGAEDPATSGVAAAGDGVLINSGELTGLPKAEALAKAIELVEAAGTGEGKVIYRLRDWLLSRQRFWGTPIPVIHCEDCGEVLVPEDQLPVLLPDNLRGEQLAPKGQSPLAAADDWAIVPCPECGKQARRDSDTMDTFVDSSWYFLRYVSPNFDEGPFDPQAMSEWGAVDMYVGGVEHAILHLLYARFFTKVVRDLGLIKHDEPFKALMNQGQVLNGGKAMSKSLGNGVNLGEQLDKFGVDAIRTTMIFASPPEDDVDWADVSPSGSQKFLARAWRVAQDVTSEPGVDATTGDLELQKLIARTVHEVQGLLDNGKFNVVVAKTMELVNATRKAIDSGAGAADPAVRKAAETVAILLSLYAPYTAEDMWHALGHDTPVLTAGFPEVDPALLVDDTVTAIVQIKGKVKARLEVAKDISEQELQELALADAAVQRSIGDAEIRKVIVRAPKLVNIVI